MRPAVHGRPCHWYHCRKGVTLRPRCSLSAATLRFPMRLVLIGLSLLIYGRLTFVGIDLMQGAASQHAPNFPNDGQITYYVRFPVAMVLLVLCALPWARRPRARWIAFPLLVPLVLFFPYILAYTGGI